MKYEDLVQMLKGVSGDIESFMVNDLYSVQIKVRSKRLMGCIVIHVKRRFYNEEVDGYRNADELINEMCIEVLQTLLIAGWHNLCETSDILMCRHSGKEKSEPKKRERYWEI